MNEYEVTLATSFAHNEIKRWRVHEIAYRAEHNDFLMPIIGAGSVGIQYKTNLPDLIVLRIWLHAYPDKLVGDSDGAQNVWTRDIVMLHISFCLRYSTKSNKTDIKNANITDRCWPMINFCRIIFIAFPFESYTKFLTSYLDFVQSFTDSA